MTSCGRTGAEGLDRARGRGRGGRGDAREGRKEKEMDAHASPRVWTVIASVSRRRKRYHSVKSINQSSRITTSTPARRPFIRHLFRRRPNIISTSSTLDVRRFDFFFFRHLFFRSISGKSSRQFFVGGTGEILRNSSSTESLTRFEIGAPLLYCRTCASMFSSLYPRHLPMSV